MRQARLRRWLRSDVRTIASLTLLSTACSRLTRSSRNVACCRGVLFSMTEMKYAGRPAASRTAVAWRRAQMMARSRRRQRERGGSRLGEASWRGGQTGSERWSKRGRWVVTDGTGSAQYRRRSANGVDELRFDSSVGRGDPEENSIFSPFTRGNTQAKRGLFAASEAGWRGERGQTAPALGDRCDDPCVNGHGRPPWAIQAKCEGADFFQSATVLARAQRAPRVRGSCAMSCGIGAVPTAGRKWDVRGRAQALTAPQIGRGV